MTTNDPYTTPQQGDPPTYGYPAGPYYDQRPQPPVNGFAIASLVLGIVWLFWLGSLLAIVFGHTALDQINKRGTTSGKGLAVAGLVLGYVGAGTFTLFFVLPALLTGV